MSGDFFPYCDSCDDFPRYPEMNPLYEIPETMQSINVSYRSPWWTGYFTTRPYLKVGVRRLESLLREAEILNSMLKIQNHAPHIDPTVQEMMQNARQNLSWLLHHDAITGTSPTHTTQNYMANLNAAIDSAHHFLSHIMTSLYSNYEPLESQSAPSGLDQQPGNPTVKIKPDLDILVTTEPTILLFNGTHNSQPLTIDMDEEKTFTVYNSLGHAVFTTVHVPLQLSEKAARSKVTTLRLESQEGSSLYCQINPFIEESSGHFDRRMRELVFEVNIDPFSSQVFVLTSQDNSSADAFDCAYPAIEVYVPPAKQQSIEEGNEERPAVIPKAKVMLAQDKDVIDLRSDKVQLTVSAWNGSLMSIRTASHTSTQTNLGIGLYNNQTISFSNNGMYVFHSDERGKLLNTSQARPVVYVYRGLLEKVVLVYMSLVSSVYRINQISQGVMMTHKVNHTSNSVMGDLYFVLQTDINNNNTLYTDSNSFVMIRRRIEYPRYPIAANYYPITGCAYIENGIKRLTLLAAQSAGVTSLSNGELEVMIDRRINGRDHAGVSDPLLDNKLVILQYLLIVESLYPEPHDPGHTSISFHHQQLLNSPPSLYKDVDVTLTNKILSKLPCDYQLINLRSLDTLPQGTQSVSSSRSYALILHRTSLLTTQDEMHSGETVLCVQEDELSGEDRAGAKVNKNLQVHILTDGIDVYKSSLSLLHQKEKLKTPDDGPLVLPSLVENKVQTFKLVQAKTSQ